MANPFEQWMPNDQAKKLFHDTGKGCSVCGGLPVVNVSDSYWLCGPCVDEKLPNELRDRTK